MPRFVMRMELRAAGPEAPEVDVEVRHPTADDAEALAELMLDAYRGTIDADGSETIDDARSEVATTLDGGYGDPMLDASYVAVEGDDLVSASLVTRYEGAPFVAFTMTRADHQGRGLARALVIRSLLALAGTGHAHVDLEVTAGNDPAVRLYRSLGFEVVDVLDDSVG